MKKQRFAYLLHNKKLIDNPHIFSHLLLYFNMDSCQCLAAQESGQTLICTGTCQNDQQVTNKYDKIVTNVNQQKNIKTQHESHIFIPVCVICSHPYNPQLAACPICQWD